VVLEENFCGSTKLKFGAETRKSLTACIKSRPGGMKGRAGDINLGLSRRIYSAATGGHFFCHSQYDSIKEEDPVKDCENSGDLNPNMNALPLRAERKNRRIDLRLS